MGYHIALGTDHGGFEEKNRLVAFLESLGHTPIDCGTHTPEPTDYPIFAARVSQLVSNDMADLGVIICRSGNGMMMVANRFPGVRAGLATSVETARLTREHNDANVLVIGADHMKGTITDVVGSWLNADFEGGRHARRVAMIDAWDILRESTLPTHKMILAGQSPWLDDISDMIIASGELAELVEHSGVRGLTSNPTIFEKAIGSGKGAYPAALAALKARGASAEEAYEELTIHDITRAADILRPVYQSTGGDDGFVSLEVLPRFGHDEEGTIREAMRLWEKIARPNLMIKVPGTVEGVRAFRRLTAAGVNVNVTLLFSLQQYRAVAAAYIGGLRDRLANGEPIHTVRSVASVFVSRVDTSVNKLLDKMAAETADATEREDLVHLRNLAGIANARVIYAEFRDIFQGDGFAELGSRGAAVQRPLWASTGVKSDDLKDTVYVEELVAAATVNTLPAKTLQAVLEHGQIARNKALDNADETMRILHVLGKTGIDLDAVCSDLQIAGLQSFADSFDSLFATIKKSLQ